jgi:hypothetical protein
VLEQHKFILLFTFSLILISVPIATSKISVVKAENPARVNPEMDIYTATYFDHKFEIPYHINNAILKNIELDIASDKLVIFIASNATTNNGGEIRLVLPRNLFWSDMLKEYDFTVLIDGKGSSEGFEPVYVQNKPCERIVSVKFPPNSETIEIMRPATHPGLRNIGTDGFIATDKPCYKQGEMVTVFGIASLPIDMAVITSEGTDFPQDEIDFIRNENGSFTARFTVQGERAFSGEYAALAEYRLDTLPMSADARFLVVERDYNDLTVGETSLIDNKGRKVSTSNKTDSYIITTEINNDSNEPKMFRYIAMLTDENDVAQSIFDGSFKVPAKQKTKAGEGYYGWSPEDTGKYKIKAFVWSSQYLPLEALAPAQSINIEVTEKIVKLGEGKRDSGLLVKDINLLDGTVAVSYLGCTNSGEQVLEETLHIGESVVFLSYDWVYLEGFENDKAIFRFEAVGGTGCPSPGY